MSLVTEFLKQATAHDLSCHLVGHAHGSLESVEGIAVEKYLAKPHYDIANKADPLSRVRAFDAARKELADFLKNSTYGLRDLLLFPTATSAVQAAVADYVSTTQNPAHCACLIMMPPGVLVDDEQNKVRVLDPVRLLFTQIACDVKRADSHVIWFASNDEHARSYQALTGHLVTQLPLPLLAAPSHKKKGRRIALYLGDARATKGVHHLPALVEILAPRLKKWTLTVQVTLSPNDREGARILEALSSLRAGFPNLVIETDYLSREAYEAHLASHDIVVLGYDPATYQDQSSGLLSEAIAAGCLIAVPDKSWLSRNLVHHGGVGEVFTEFTPHSIAAAINKLTRASFLTRRRARKAGDAFRAWVDQRPTIDALLKWYETGTPPGDRVQLGNKVAAYKFLNLNECALSGWHDFEDGVMWAKQDHALFATDLPKKGKVSSLSIGILFAETNLGEQSLCITMNGQTVHDAVHREGNVEITLDLPADCGGSVYLEFSGFKLAQPVSGDARILGLGLLRATFQTTQSTLS